MTEEEVYAALEGFVGKKVSDVHKALEDEFAPYAIQFVEEGSFVTMDFVPTRIRCWYLPTTTVITRFSIG